MLARYVIKLLSKMRGGLRHSLWTSHARERSINSCIQYALPK